MGGGAWQATVHEVTKSQTQLSNFTHSLTHSLTHRLPYINVMVTTNQKSIIDTHTKRKKKYNTRDNYQITKKENIGIRE